MKLEMSALDIRFIVKELQKAVGSKINKISSINNGIEFYFYSSKTGKLFLTIANNLVYLSNDKHQLAKLQTLSNSAGPTGGPTGFVAALRKYLGSGAVVRIEQPSFERIIVFCFESNIGNSENNNNTDDADSSDSTKKTKKQCYLIAELFGQGNLILCNSSWKIIVSKSVQEFSQRKISASEQYKFPEGKFDFLAADFGAFYSAVSSSGKDVAVKALAAGTGIGRKVATEVFCRLNILHDEKNLSELQWGEVFSELKNMLDDKIDKNSSRLCAYAADSGEFAEFFPFKPISKSPDSLKSFETLSDAIQYVVSLSQNQKPAEKSQSDRLGEKLKKTLEEQQAHLAKLMAAADAERRKGELLYEHYSEIVGLLAQAKKGVKHPLVKEFASDKRFVTIEIEDEKI